MTQTIKKDTHLGLLEEWASQSRSTITVNKLCDALFCFIGNVRAHKEDYTNEQVATYLNQWEELLNECSFNSKIGFISREMATLSLLGFESAKETLQDILEKSETSPPDLSEKQQHAVITACQVADLALPSYIKQGEVIDSLISKKDSRGTYENVLKHYLKELGFNICEDRFYPVTLSYVDQVATCEIAGETHYFYFQVDGDTHFKKLSNGDRVYNKSTLLQNAMVENGAAPNEHFVRFSHEEIEAASDLKQFILKKVSYVLEYGASHRPTTTDIHSVSLDERSRLGAIAGNRSPAV